MDVMSSGNTEKHLSSLSSRGPSFPKELYMKLFAGAFFALGLSALTQPNNGVTMLAAITVAVTGIRWLLQVSPARQDRIARNGGVR